MSFQAVQMRALERLLKNGEVSAALLEGLPAGKALGLWAAFAEDNLAVITSTLIKLYQSLPDAPETIAAVFACEAEIRPSWLRIIAARLKEMGARRDVAGLCQAISFLGPASEAIYSLLPSASLQATSLSKIEIALFGAPAEQAAVTPKLMRVIGVTAELVEGARGVPAAPLPDVDAEDPSINWIRGRVLCLPDNQEQTEKVSVLSGQFTPCQQVVVSGKSGSQTIMRWVLARPWAFLLAQVVFTQEAWAAERISGKLSLEIEPAQLARYHQPAQVMIVVSTRDGAEVVCGTLGELLLRLFGQLGITLLTARLSPAELDDALAPVIHELLQHRVWRFHPGHQSHQRPGYEIHEDFSDACYRAYGSKYFYRLGSAVTHAIRNACVVWAEERLALAGTQQARAEVAG